MNDEFQVITNQLLQNDVEAALECAAKSFIAAEDAHRLFEIRKLQARWRQKIPIVYWQRQEKLSDQQQLALDRQLLAACREAATGLLAQGNILAAWPYLEPLDDRDWVRNQIESMPIEEINIDSIIECAFNRGAHPLFGFRLILKNRGTCNGITILDSSAPFLDRSIRQTLATELVNHFFGELLKNINSDGRNELGELEFVAAVTNDANEPNVLGGPHIDSTHLHSVIRIGQIVDEPTALRRLLALTRYGKGLPTMFHFPGTAPFADHFADYDLFYSALLNPADPKTELSLKHFEQKVATARGTMDSLNVTETVVDWLARIGRVDRAIELATQYEGDDFGQLSIAPNLIELASTSSFAAERMAEYFQQRDDLLSFVMTRLSTHSAS